MARRGRPKHPDILTPREWEVLALIREDLTNDQIGQRLGIGAEGAKYHVSEILGKLGLSSREEAAAWDPRQRPDWTPRWDPTRRPAWATALAPLGLFWRRLAGGLAHSAGSLATVTSVGLGVALVAGITIFAVAVVRTRGSSNDASATPPAVVGQSTSEACPAATGKIAFKSNRDGNPEIYVMNADGSGQTNLTNGPGDDSFGAWSPDGCRIAFTSDRDGNNEVYVVAADGSGLTNLSNNPGDDGVVRDESTIGGWAASAVVAWSPDGSRIAFISSRDGNWEVYVVNADGSGLTNLTKDPGDDAFPAWSPDGSRIAFTSARDNNWEIYVVNADGSGLSNLTNDLGDTVIFGPAWSPDGSRIVFNVGYEIYVMNADGSGQTRLTKDDNVDVWPAWSPDGSRIAFSSGRDGSYEIYVMNADGSGQTRLTNSWGYQPAWSPDGSRIVLNSYPGVNVQEIYVVNADGSGETNLTNNPANDHGPAWSPDGSRIAFYSDRDRDGNSEIYVVTADGSGLTNLTNNPGFDYDPVWSPAR